MLSLEGRQLGNYDVIRRIRTGGMGAVYEGRQRTAFGRRVAIKVILGDYAADPDMRRRFAREARTIARLHHPHILPLIEFGDEQGVLYLVMPFIDGGTLTSYLRRGLPDLHEVAAIYQQLLDAIEYAHDEGLIHRDIKSSNVLLEQRRSGAPYAYLADFGLVRTARQASLEQAGEPIPLDQVPGTPHYMAPEQTRGIVTPLTDIYALGVLLYQMLTGELPYDDPDEIRIIQMHLQAPIPSASAINASIPTSLDRVIRTAMAKHPEDRYDSVAALRAAFLAALQEPGITIEDVEEAIEDEPAHEPVHSPSAPLLPPEPAMPVTDIEELPLEGAPRRVKQAVALPPPQRRRRTTDTVRYKPHRLTDSIPGRHKRKRSTLPVAAIALVPLLLLALLVASRALGLSFFPVGVPLLGADPTATITITAQSKTVEDTYLVTASVKTANLNLATRVIPARFVSQTVTGSTTTQATGSSTLAGTQATGSLLFANSANTPVYVAAGHVFTSLSGVQVQTTQAVTVPRRQDGQNGVASAPAIAVFAGSAGNIPADGIMTKCCNSLLVSNPGAFSGGTDARTVPVVTQADLDRASNALRSRLQQSALIQLLKQLHTGEVLVALPNYSTAISSNNHAGAQASQVTVQVQVTATGIAYNHNLLDQLVAQLLSSEATQTLGSSYQPHGLPSIDVPRLVQQGKNGVAYLSVTAHGAWVYSFTSGQINQWRQTIKGATSEAALAFLSQQTGVAAVQIHLPFGADHLPTSTDQIRIVVQPGT